MHGKCLAYTFQQTEMKCSLHSITDRGQRYVRGLQTGLKKTDYILSLPELSFCSDKNRQRRCRREPKCHHVDCLRKAQEFYKSFRRLSVNFAHFPDIEWTFDGQISNSNSSGGNNIWAVDDKRRVTLENVICYYNNYNTIFIELNLRMNGYDAGFIRDEYGCNLDKCECQHYDQFVIGKILDNS